MFELKIVSKFAAAHRLREIGGKCEDLHGHNWKVEAYVIGEELNSQGILVDFVVLKRYLKEILSKLDHKYLNEVDVFKDRNPSSENIAKFIFKSLQKRFEQTNIRVSRVNAWESDTSCASYFEP